MVEKIGLGESGSNRGWIRDTVLLIVGAVITVVVTYVWTEYIQPQPIYLSITINDVEPPHSPLKNAAVGLDLNDGHHEGITGPFGVVGFTLSHKDKWQRVTPKITLDEYQTPQGGLLPAIALDSELINSHIDLERIIKKPPVVTDKPPDKAPSVVTSQEVYRSDNLPSGAAKDFSSPYTLCSPPKPASWKIVDAGFYLVGDRSCGAWSICKPLSRTDTNVCWQFQMQGHDEQAGFLRPGNTGIQYSTGVLTVTWQHPQ